MRWLRPALSLLAFALAGCDCGGGGSLNNVRARLEYDPAQIDFGRVLVGDLRVANFNLANKGDLGLAISRFFVATSTAHYRLLNGAPTQLAPREMQRIAVAFSPQRVGKIMGTLSIIAADDPAPRTVVLLGEGVRSGAKVTPDGETCGGAPGSLSFGRVVPGQSADRTIAIEATGNAPLQILSAAMEPGSAPAFSVDPVPSGTKLDPGGRFDLHAHYRPASGGMDRGAILIQTDAPDQATMRVPVCGAGIAPAICAHPVPLDVGAVAVGMTKSGTLHVKSCGVLPLEISSIALSQEAAHPTDSGFALGSVPSLPLMLAPDAEADLEVRFTATALGPRTGFVQIDSNALDQARAFFPIQAAGAMPCDLAVLPSRLVWNRIPIGQSSSKDVVVTNSGSSDCTIDRVEITAGAPLFALPRPPQLPINVASGGMTTLTIDYRPRASGMDNGRLEVAQGARTLPVELVGNPADQNGCQIEVVPSALSFGLVAVNTTRMLGLELHNLSTRFCFLTRATIDPASSPGFSEMPGLGAITPGGRITLNVSYHPTAPGSARGVLHVVTTDTVTPQVDVPLVAQAAPPAICVEPTLLAFGGVPVGNSSSSNFNIYACGAQNVTVTRIDWSVPNTAFTMSNVPPLPLLLTAGARTPVTVRYAPTVASASDRAVATIRSDDPAIPSTDVIATGNAFVPADAPVYVHTADTLFSYDPTGNTVTQIGRFTNIMTQMTDIAIDSMGHMYGVTGDGAVWDINPRTAASSMLFTVPGGPVGLTCLSDGSLVVGGDRLLIVDPRNPTMQRNLVPPGRFETSGDAIALPDGQLYWTVDRGRDRVLRVDPNSGAITQLPQLSVTDIYGLGYANGQLFGFSSHGRAVVIDSMTGMVTRDLPLPGMWNGATTNPVRW